VHARIKFLRVFLEHMDRLEQIANKMDQVTMVKEEY
jgi:hypothetical protein